MNSKQKLFYIHTPKTAGSSLNKHFSRLFPSNYLHVEGADYNQEFVDRFDFVSGHVTFTQAQKVIDDKFLTMITLREPYSYAVSHLCWVRKLADEGEEERFLSHPKVFQDVALKMKEHDFSNPADIVKFICWLDNIDFKYFHNTQTLYLDGAKRVKEAVSNLRKVNFVGTLEGMSKFITMVSDFFGYTDKYITPEVNKNSNKYGFDLSCQDTRDALFPLLDRDIHVYEAAKKFFESDYRQYIYSKSKGEEFRSTFLCKKDGRVGGIDKGRVFGWCRLLNVDSTEYCSVDIYLNDCLLGTVMADQFRRDLNKKHSKNCAFFMKVPTNIKLSIGDTMSAKFHGTQVDLENSPFLVDDSSVAVNNKIQGRLDRLDSGRVTGWARYPNQIEDSFCEVDIYLNDNFLMTANADKYRKGLNERFGYNCAIDEELPSGTFLSIGDQISARPRGELFDLVGGAILVKKRDFATADGRLGGVSSGKIIGWARRKLDKKPLAVALFMNEKKLATITANQFRADLDRRFGVSCGFSLEIPSQMIIQKGDTLRARVVGETTDLENSPLVLNQGKRAKL